MAEKDSKQKTTAKTTTKPKPAAAPKTTATATKPAAKPAAKATADKQTAKDKSAVKSEPKTSVKPAVKPSAATTSKANTKTTAAKEETKVKTAEKTAPAKTSVKPAATAKAAQPSSAKAAKQAEKPATPDKAAATQAKSNEQPAKAKTAASVTNAKEKTMPVKQKKAKSTNKANTEAVATTKGTKMRVLIITAVALVMIAALIIGIVLGAKSCNGGLPRKGQADYYDINAYNTSTTVGYSAQKTGTVSRYKPVSEIKNEGLSAYPKYGSTLKEVIGDTAERKAARSALIRESSYLTATGTTNAGGGGYTWMDKDGLLFSGTTAEPVPTIGKDGVTQRQLYQHSASVGLYLGDVSDDEPGIIKTVYMRNRGYTRGYGVTGVYAPAGEVIKIEISEADMEATGGIVIHIGQALYNGKANNIWTDKDQMQRMPHLLNTMTVDKNTSTLKNGVYTAYVGSFLGGPLYIRNESVSFTATISGGVAYSHFILGYTTEKEFEENAKSSAPYFDLEVWNYGVLHSGPKTYAKNFSYEDIYKAAILWDKVASVTTTGNQQGIVFLYDPFVAAGAAVAFPGQGSVNCPAGWMTASLNYDAIVSSGSWGNFHEYHHNFQGYGVGNGGEVTNNAMTLVSYSLFTKISSARGTGNYGASGMSGWNRYTSATWALNETLKISRGGDPENGKKGLSLYATLLHNFGPDAFIQSKVKQRATSAYGENYSGYLQAWQDITHNDMTYYFKDILQGIDDATATTLSKQEYSKFVPVSSIYQTGRSYMYDGEKKYVTTMQPYVIPYGKDFTVDLREYVDALTGSIVIPDGFSYQIKDIKQPEHGTIAATGTDNVYTFTPDKNSRSGEIIVTLSITKDDGAFTVDDVDLVLEFQQTHETTKWTLERTTYTYNSNNPFESAVAAYEANYGDYTTVVAGDNINPNHPTTGRVVQDCNAEVWYVDKPEPNSVVEIKGKMYAEEAAKYRIALRGRWNTALYVSVGNEDNYELAATFVQTGTNYRFPNTEGTYKDYELAAETWVYFKAVLLTGNNGSTASFIGVGWGKFTPELGSYDEEGNLVDYQPESVNVSSTNAYRSSYEFSKEEFTTDYFYTRKYTYSYIDNVHANAEQTLISTNYAAGNSWNWSLYPKENLTDGNRNTYIHTKNGVGGSAAKPLEFLLDMGEAKAVNRLVFHTQNRPNGDWHAPKDFTLYGSVDGSEFFTVGEFTNAPRVGTSITVNFDEQTFRYYKIVITGSHASLIILSEIELWRAFEVKNGSHYSPDNSMFTYKGKWSGVQTASSFGHAYIGANGAKMTFEFTGTRVAILSSNAYDKKFKVYIDGKKVDSVVLKEDSSPFGVSYICDKLAKGTHKVEVRLSGKSTIDSVVTFDEAE